MLKLEFDKILLYNVPIIFSYQVLMNLLLQAFYSPSYLQLLKEINRDLFTDLLFFLQRIM